MTKVNTVRKVMVTGAGGNLGQKVVEALAREPWCEKVVGVVRTADRSKFSDIALERLELVESDLTRREGAWVDQIGRVDAVIHFAALNPLPDSTWEQALASYDMTLNLLLESARQGVKRFVFASSNHAVGAYKDLPLAAQMGPGKLSTSLPPAPGTHWFDGTHEVHSLAYGSSKVMAEKLCASVAELTKGELTCVSVRVGWALTGDNDPREITHSGSPASSAEEQQLDEDAQRALRWFRNMWLSNGDLGRLFASAVTADSQGWPSSAVIVNGVSNNKGMDWDLSSAREYLGYEPHDDLYQHVQA